MDLDHNILAVVEPALMPTEIKIYAAGEEEGGDKSLSRWVISSHLLRLISMCSVEIKLGQ
jgi:hypothetical protein